MLQGGRQFTFHIIYCCRSEYGEQTIYLEMLFYLSRYLRVASAGLHLYVGIPAVPRSSTPYVLRPLRYATVYLTQPKGDPVVADRSSSLCSSYLG